MGARFLDTDMRPDRPIFKQLPEVQWAKMRPDLVIAGTAILACDGKKAEFGPGGFNYMPARMVHEAWVGAGSVTFITVDGPWDINWVEGAPTAADVTP